MITAITAAGAWLAAPGAAPAAPSLPSARELAGINCHSEDFAYSYSDLEDGSDAWENCVLDGLGLLDDSEVDAPADDG